MSILIRTAYGLLAFALASLGTLKAVISPSIENLLAQGLMLLVAIICVLRASMVR